MSRFALKQEGVYSAVGLHAIGFMILAIATVVLGVRVGLDWRTTSTSNQDAMAARQSELKTLQLQTTPLRGLDKKVDLSRDQIDNFYETRIPANWSAIIERLGDLQTKSDIRLTRVGYTTAPGSGDLTEIRMEAGLSGDYAQIMKFINGLERSQTFFVIRAMNLTGQQSGSVNMRLQVSTWLRPSDAAAMPSASTPASQQTSSQVSQSGGQSKIYNDAGSSANSRVKPSGLAQSISNTPQKGEGY